MEKELAVAALKNGTVIDHIPCDVLFKAVDLLGIASLDKSVTIGNNLDSKALGRKGIIKIADTYLTPDILSRIALIAPKAVVNTIRDYRVASKEQVKLPDMLEGIVVCDNPKCVTRNQPITTRFHVTGHSPVTVKCHYCEHEQTGENIKIG